MKTTNKASTLQRLKSGIGAAIANMAAARGLDHAVAEAALMAGAGRPRAGYRDRSSGGARPAGSKLARKAAEGRLTLRHTV